MSIEEEEEEEEDGQMYYARMARMQEWLSRLGRLTISAISMSDVGT